MLCFHCKSRYLVQKREQSLDWQNSQDGQESNHTMKRYVKACRKDKDMPQVGLQPTLPLGVKSTSFGTQSSSYLACMVTLMWRMVKCLCLVFHFLPVLCIF